MKQCNNIRSSFLALALTTTLSLWATPHVHAATIVQYTFPGGTFSPTTTASNTTATAVNGTGSSASLQAGAALPNTFFLSPTIASTTPTTAVSNNQFFQFSVTPDAGFEFDLTNLAFNAGRGGASTPRGWVLRSSLDGFATDIATATIPTVQPTLTPFLIDLSGLAFQNVVSLVTFRIYNFTPSSGSGIFYDNLTLNGSVTQLQAVPEPATWALLAAGICGSLGYRRQGRSMR